MILQLGLMLKRSPFASVKVLLSSNTEFKFSIQMLSTGPSSTSHTNSSKNIEFILRNDFRKFKGGNLQTSEATSFHLNNFFKKHHINCIARTFFHF